LIEAPFVVETTPKLDESVGLRFNIQVSQAAVELCYEWEFGIIVAFTFELTRFKVVVEPEHIPVLGASFLWIASFD
jgi:hypothetical protein